MRTRCYVTATRRKTAAVWRDINIPRRDLVRRQRRANAVRREARGRHENQHE
jgi:hypothetical protein